MNGFRPDRREVQVLLACARTKLDPSAPTTLRRLAGRGLDWPLLVRLAARHGVSPLLSRALGLACRELVPPDIQSRLETEGRVVAIRNLVRARELCRIVSAFGQARVTVVPFKGPLLAAAAYGSLSLRPFTDLDLFVEKNDLVRACGVLIGKGYRPREGSTQEGAEPPRPGRYNGFVNEAGVAVDLQSGFEGDGFSYPLPSVLWERADTQQLLGVEMRVFPPEETLVLLCVHGWKHSWDRLMWICDVAELIGSHPRLDPARVMTLARSCGSVRIVELGLVLAKDLLGVGFPSGDPLRADPRVRQIAGRVQDRLFDEAPRPPDLWEAALARLSLKDTRRARAAYAAAALGRGVRLALRPTPEDRRAVALPRCLTPLYAAVRAVRLVRTYGRTPRRLARKIVQHSLEPF